MRKNIRQKTLKWKINKEANGDFQEEAEAKIYPNPTHGRGRWVGVSMSFTGASTNSSGMNQVKQVKNTVCSSICIFPAVATLKQFSWGSSSPHQNPFFPSVARDKFTHIDRKWSLFLCSISVSLIRLTPLPKRITEITLINFPANLPAAPVRFRRQEGDRGGSGGWEQKNEGVRQDEITSDGAQADLPPHARFSFPPFPCVALVLFPTFGSAREIQLCRFVVPAWMDSAAFYIDGVGASFVRLPHSAMQMLWKVRFCSRSMSALPLRLKYRFVARA